MLDQMKVEIRRKLQNNGTNVDQNDADPYGDGDQSPLCPGILDHPHRTFHREFWATGGDIEEHLVAQGMSNFALSCVLGQVEAVKAALEKAEQQDNQNEEWKRTVTMAPTTAAKCNDTRESLWPGTTVKRLLEFRETSLRLSPLLMMASVAKNVSLHQAESSSSSAGVREGKLLQVVHLLLNAGARTGAQDVVGKTVCHYGMGMAATRQTLAAVGVCVEAHQSSHLQGRWVKLVGLQNQAQLNGTLGLVKGFVVPTRAASSSGAETPPPLQGRRAVYLPSAGKEISVKPQNLALIAPGSKEFKIPKPIPLVDIRDRLGGTCLLEAVQANREDVCQLLVHTYKADWNIRDYDDLSPLVLAQTTPYAASDIVRHAASRAAHLERKSKETTCAWCHKSAQDLAKENDNSDNGNQLATPALSSCARCRRVNYCSKECQRQHWKVGGHKQECQVADSKLIILRKPVGNSEMPFAKMVSMKSLVSGSGIGKSPIQREGTGFSKPPHVQWGEKFYIKVQCGETMETPLLVYDKTRTLEFSYSKESHSFAAIFKLTRNQQATNGRKTYVYCSFMSADKPDELSIYPESSTIKTW